MIKRNEDVIAGLQDLEHLHTFHGFPVFMGCTDEPQAKDLTADMQFWISRGSGMIQMNPLLPLDVLYPEAHGAGCVGASWARHHQELADFIGQFNPTSVLEIGGAHGILASKYQAQRAVPWTILEPNPTPIPGCQAKIIKGFFDEHFRIEGDIDAIVHSHVFEHIYYPDAFVRQLANFQPVGKKLIFSVPNMREMLERKFTNHLNFEHTIYLSEDYIEFLLASAGYLLLQKKYFLDDHSIFYAAVRDKQVTAVALAADLYAKNKSLYLNYVGFHKEMVLSINKSLEAELQENVYLFGAHVQSQYMIGFGLDVQKVASILDNDPVKHGRRLYGTDKYVAGPEVLKGLDSPVVVIRAGTFTSEIVSQIKDINPTTRFIL